MSWVFEDVEEVKTNQPRVVGNSKSDWVFEDVEESLSQNQKISEPSAAANLGGSFLQSLFGGLGAISPSTPARAAAPDRDWETQSLLLLPTTLG